MKSGNSIILFYQILLGILKKDLNSFMNKINATECLQCVRPTLLSVKDLINGAALLVYLLWCVEVLEVWLWLQCVLEEFNGRFGGLRVNQDVLVAAHSNYKADMETPLNLSV